MANIFDLFKQISTGQTSNTAAVEYIVVGLGNPDKKYENTRHNAGFIGIDHISQKCGAKIDRAKFSALVGEATIAGKRVLLMKPQTYMNHSGKAVSEAAKFYKIPIEKIIVLSDDISLDVGRLRVRRNGSHGGQRGLLSIEEHMSSREYPRIKIGVGQKPHPEYDLADWVLSNFSADELKKINENLDTVFEGLCKILSGDLEGAMQICNHK
jgi:PTH1 family peptidyl-tRNA hydrolase